LRLKYALVLFLSAAVVAGGAAVVAANFNRTVEPKHPLTVCSLKEVRSGAWNLEFLGQEVEVDLAFLGAACAKAAGGAGRAAREAWEYLASPVIGLWPVDVPVGESK